MADDGLAAGRAAGAADGDAAALTGDRALLALMAWLSPAFPVGGFTYSHGLEWAIEDGTVTSVAGLEAWMRGVLDHGAGRNDAILLAAAFRAASVENWTELAAVAELAAAMQPSRERRLESTAQGAAFVKAILDCWPNPRFTRLVEALADGAEPAVWTYPVAVAAAAAAHGLPLRPTLAAFLQAFVGNVISAGVRAVPLGQTEGQRLIGRLGPEISRLADAALAASLDDLGGAALRADIASMKHETQYTRLFRS